MYGGGVEINGGSATIANSTLSGNHAGPTTNGAGGGVDGQPGTMVTLVDSAVANNTSASNAGGVRIQGTGTIERTTVSGNTAAGGFAGESACRAPSRRAASGRCGSPTAR